KQVRCLRSVHNSGLRRFANKATHFHPAQLLQILGDKYDANYRVRRLLGKRKADREQSVILLPTAYVNVSRAALSYAKVIPDCNFLLIATRQSGWLDSLPENISAARLAWYAPGKCDEEEYKYLLARWREL